MSAAAGGAGAGGSAYKIHSTRREEYLAELKALTFSIVNKDPPMYKITTKEKKNEITVTRNVVMVEAKFSDDTVFWRQPFYRSSGTSSGYAGMWFPFLAITQDAYVKGEPVPAEWPNLDKLHVPRGMSYGTKSLKLRILAYSFLVASYNLLVPVEDKKRIRYIYPKEQIEKFINALRGEITDKGLFDTIIKWLYDQTPTLTSTLTLSDDSLKAKIVPDEKSLVDLTGKDYDEINEWIGTDIYLNYGRTGKLISAADRADPGYAMMRMKAEIEAKKAAAAEAAAGAGASGGRRRRTQKRRRHRYRRKSKSNHSRRTARRQR